MPNRYLICSFIFLLIFTSCSKEDININIQPTMENLKKIPQKKWDQLSKQRIYFGHQSVGYNMIDGIEMILDENPNIHLKIEKKDALKTFDQPVFAHSSIGKNRDPIGKIDDFCKKIENGLGDKLDIAGFKLCYVDIIDGSDVQKIFNNYKKRINELALKYPKIKIIHFTVPTMSLQSGPKALIKKILGKDIGIKNNIAKQEFNELLLEEYNSQPVFDLAKAESTYPNGSREYVEVNGKRVITMVPAYTSDGGHLSKKGKISIGSDFLMFLAKISNDRSN